MDAKLQAFLDQLKKSSNPNVAEFINEFLGMAGQPVNLNVMRVVYVPMTDTLPARIRVYSLRLKTINMFYAIFADGDYLETGLNATSRFEVKEALLSLLEPETDEDDFKQFFGMNVYDICATKGWTLETSEQRFDLRPTFRVVAAVTTYCYLDVRAKDADEARRIASETDGGDYYTMDNSERPGSFNIEEVNPIS